MIAIHTKSGGFAAGWLKYCVDNDIPFKEVDCFSSEIVSELSDCRALMWHWSHNDFGANVFARQLIASLEKRGLTVFPSIETCWHFDDKVGQKYLLESIEAPIVRSFAFYDSISALKWVSDAPMPLVWKLRGGAGSRNVKLVRTRDEARRIIRRSFRKGWRTPRLHAFSERLRAARERPSLKSIFAISRGLVRAIAPHQVYRHQQAQRGYVYFQQFIPNNDHDIRVVVIGDRAFAIKRMVRENDFRASGSGTIIHDHLAIPQECVRLAFDTTRKMQAQCCAFDFVQSDGEWRIIEVSYGFSLAGYVDCTGYWRSDMSWNEGRVLPESFMVEDVVDMLQIP